jgi:hypothetical protein
MKKTAVTSNTRSFNTASGFDISTSVKNIYGNVAKRENTKIVNLTGNILLLEPRQAQQISRFSVQKLNQNILYLWKKTRGVKDIV